jgi:hypothetical protein
MLVLEIKSIRSATSGTRFLLAKKKAKQKI